MMALFLLACRLSDALFVFIYVELLLIRLRIYERAQLLCIQGFIKHLRI